MRRTARAQIPTTCITSVEHLFVPACYILYISIRFFSFFSPPFFPPPSFRSTPPPPFSRIQLPPPVYYTHTYVHTKRMLMRASRNTRIGVTAQLIKTQRFSRDHLDRSIPLHPFGQDFNDCHRFVPFQHHLRSSMMIIII